MQRTVRSQLLAGVASATVVGSVIAVAPMAPQIDLPDVHVPSIQTAALANAFAQNAQILAYGFADSLSAINATLPNALAAPSQVIGGFQRDTNQIPIIIGDVFRGGDTQITGVSPVERPEPGTNYDPGAQNPGFYAPTDSAPGGTYTMNPAVIAGPIVAVDRVANNFVAANVPGANTFQAVESSARRLGVTGVQVQSLVRTNGFEAVNSVYKTAYDGGTPQQVAKAAVDGAVHVTQSITGAPVGTAQARWHDRLRGQRAQPRRSGLGCQERLRRGEGRRRGSQEGPRRRVAERPTARCRDGDAQPLGQDVVGMNSDQHQPGGSGGVRFGGGGGGAGGTSPSKMLCATLPCPL